MGAEGYCVNVPWSRGGVGDNDYIFAFQHVVLPIGCYFLTRDFYHNDNFNLYYLIILFSFWDK